MAVSNVQATNISIGSAVITWDTSELETSQVIYGRSFPLELVSALNTQLTLSHTVSLSNLHSSATYYFTIEGYSPIDALVVEWDAPTQNVDDSEVTDFASYNFYYGMASRTYDTVVNIGSNTSVNIVVPRSTYYCAVTAIDLSGNESEYSAEVIKFIDYSAAPSFVTDGPAVLIPATIIDPPALVTSMEF